ncbi:MAG: phenylalanine--tRNA ligase subunit beta [Gemmatimonadales bacterium]|nr:phenylalanine--tRNA ligase subunit beta [Gemmatimonadales bacterium]
MNVSTSWLGDFLRRPIDAADAARRLAMLGAPADAVEPLHAGLGGIIVARVESAVPHPNADRLRVCRVNDGSGTERNVVCGAPNVEAGHMYPLAPVGATLPGGLKIERRKLRGEVSEGMLCSARELGLGDDASGLWELDTEAAPGTPLLQAIPLADTRLVLDITPNRPDLLGHKGIARELAASLRVPFRLPAIAGSPGATLPAPRREAATGTVAGVRVAIEDPDGCPRFLSAVVRGVRVAPSPDWLSRRLAAVGVRSINNVVDATNYVMLELNQPMHAYDLSRLRGPAVVARAAKPGERVVTLDGADRALDETMTVIADAEGVIGIAGVMGGAGTEVSEATTDLFLECAFFDPASIRRTRRALGLSTEASYRFERGIDRWNGAEALRRCVELIQVTAGGAVDGDAVDLWPRVTHPPRIFLRPARVARVLGIELPWHAIEQYLVAIGATVVSKPDDGRIAVDVPGWRPDLVEEIDLIEEVARLHGYDEITTELRRARPGTRADDPAYAAADRIRGALVAQGLFEVASLPMTAVSTSAAVRILNPLSSSEGFLRADLLPGLVRLTELNWAVQTRDVRLFEVGTVFRTIGPGEAGTPRESQRVAAIVTGARTPAHWSQPAGADVDIWDLKGLFEAAIAVAQPAASVAVNAGRLIAVVPGGAEVGHARVLRADAPPWAAPVYGFEVELDTSAQVSPVHRALPTTPASGRDLTILLPDDLPVARVAQVLRSAGVVLLEAVHVTNEYRNPVLPGGMRSVTFHLTFRANDRTLEAAEVDQAESRLLNALQRELGVHRRDQGAPAPE